MAGSKDIEHVVVLMMENRSFDHMLKDGPLSQSARRGSNSHAGQVYTQAALPLTGPFDLKIDSKRGFDPRHEFDNAWKQLGWSGGVARMDGFAADAADTLAAIGLTGKDAEPWIQQVMNYVPFGASADADPLPAIQGLARHFTVCDRWFSSLPGPTWANRFFALMGSCHGRVRMPGNWTDVPSAVSTFLKQVCRESIFTQLDKHGVPYRMFADGDTPLAFMVKGSGGRHTVAEFEQAAQAGTLPAFCWIEPSYGFLHTQNNSQHPPADLRAGDAFIARIFNAITANQQAWSKTLFVLLYDEHGGFYDPEPPPATVAPDDSAADVEVNGAPFDFTLLGPRVPAILASPRLKHQLDSRVYDHTSLLAFLCARFGLDAGALGRRTAQAQHFGDADIWLDAPRADVLALRLRTPDMPAQRGVGEQEETALATDTRKLVQAVHAYLTGGDMLAAGDSIPGQRDLAWMGLPSSKLLGAMAERSVQLLQAAGLPGAHAATLQQQAMAPRPAMAGRADKLRVLCIHGVGHGDGQDGWRADPGWEQRWEEVIHAQLSANGIAKEAVDIDYLRYDTLFGDGPSVHQIARGLAILAEGLLPLGEPSVRAFGFADVTQVLRWTAGMAIQWLEDAGLRAQLRQALLAKFSNATRPDIVLAHSLGSLIAYDTFRRAVASAGADLALINGASLATFGSQIGHPVVVREAWGGLLAPLHDEQGRGIARWFHLYNRFDKIFTRPLTFRDPGRTDLDTPFGNNVLDALFSLDHAGELYLGQPAAVTSMWPALARHPQLQRVLASSMLASRRGSAMKAVRRRALLVGINEYPEPGMALRGCVNDVYQMSRMLQESGYAAADVRLLVDARATQANLTEHLAWLVDDTRPGDERIFFYSGHGAQTPAYGPSGYADHLDESLVPYDFNWDDPSTYFTDKQFRHFYTHLPFGMAEGDARLICIFDCCHAGGMTRGGKGLVRSISMPPDIMHRMLRWDRNSNDWRGRAFVGTGEQPRAFSRNGKRVPQRGQRGQGTAYGMRPFDDEQLQAACAAYGHRGPYMPLLMYAAGQNQLASECVVGAQSYGAFTHALVKAVAAAPATGRSFEQLVQQAAQHLAEDSYLQTPELVGPVLVRNGPCGWR